MGKVDKMQLEGSPLGTKVTIYLCVGGNVYFNKTDDNFVRSVAKVVIFHVNS